MNLKFRQPVATIQTWKIARFFLGFRSRLVDLIVEIPIQRQNFHPRKIPGINFPENLRFPESETSDIILHEINTNFILF